MKHYEKPQLFMEEFTMAENIARCGINHPEDDPNNGQGWFDWISNMYMDQCLGTIDPGGMDLKMFLNENTCNEENGAFIPDEGLLDGFGVCYQGNTNGGTVLFHS